MVQAMDTEIGRLFDSLSVMHKMDSTDVIFIGDNGQTARTAQIADLTKAKGTVYQYGVHVPFIIAGPSVVNQGRTSDALVNTTDIFATVLDLFKYTAWPTQIPSSKPIDSKSLFPIIKNTGTSIRPWAFCEIFKLITDIKPMVSISSVLEVKSSNLGMILTRTLY
jgi:arylsulfatase A-like enzyme